MKIGVLKAIGHNIAHSLASGVGFLIGYYPYDIFGEASRSSDGHIIVDFLTGDIIAGEPTDELKKVVGKYATALSQLCEKHGVSRADIKKLTARFGTTIEQQRRVIVTVENEKGRTSTETYYDFTLSKTIRKS